MEKLERIFWELDLNGTSNFFSLWQLKYFPLDFETFWRSIWGWELDKNTTVSRWPFQTIHTLLIWPQFQQDYNISTITFLLLHLWHHTTHTVPHPYWQLDVIIIFILSSFSPCITLISYCIIPFIIQSHGILCLTSSYLSLSYLLFLEHACTDKSTSGDIRKGNFTFFLFTPHPLPHEDSPYKDT